MSRCKKCKVEIKDDAALCPLCKTVLEKTGTVENMYPDVRIIIKKRHLLVRIYAFVAIVVETCLLYFNYRSFEGSFWSIVAGVVLLYGYIAQKITFKDDLEYKTKSIILIMIAILSIILIDVLTGFDGWSLNYFLPGGILLLNTGIILVMLFDMRNWQGYVMIELLALIWSVVPFVLYQMGILTNTTMSLAAGAYSLFLFLGTIIIGGKRTVTELQRRFHVR